MLVHLCLFLLISSGYSARRNVGFSHLGILDAQVGKSILNSSDDAPQWWDDAKADLRTRLAKARRTISPKTPEWWSRFTTGVRRAVKTGAAQGVVNASRPQPKRRSFIGKAWASLSKAKVQPTDSTPDSELTVGAPVAVVNAAQPQLKPKSVITARLDRARKAKALQSKAKIEPNSSIPVSEVTVGAPVAIVNAAQPHPKPKSFAASQSTDSTPDSELTVGAPVTTVVNAVQPQLKPKSVITARLDRARKAWTSQSQVGEGGETKIQPNSSTPVLEFTIDAAEIQPEPKSFSLPMTKCSGPPENSKVVLQISNAAGIGIMVNFYSTQSEEGVQGMRMLGSFLSEVSAEEIPQKSPIPIIEKDLTSAHRIVFSDKGKFFNLGRMQLSPDYATMMLFIDDTFDPEKYYAKSDERYLKEDSAEYTSAQSHHNSFVSMLSHTQEKADAEGVIHYVFHLDASILEREI